MNRIVVLGSGFGALATVRALRRRVSDAEITVVAPTDELVLYPSLVGVAVGEGQGERTRVGLRDFFERHDVTFVRATVEGITNGGRTVVTNEGEIENDVLVIATGSGKVSTPPGLEHTLSICSNVETADEIGRRLRSLTSGTIACGFAGNPKDPSGVRGGPALELLLSVDTYLRREGRRDAVDLVFFSPAENPGERLGRRAVSKVMAMMADREIRPHVGHKIRGFEEGRVLTEGGDIEADVILFVPGMAGPLWARATSLPLSAGGFIRADQACRVLGHPGVYVVGDAGAYESVEEWMPKQGHAAEVQGAVAAWNIARAIEGRGPLRSFRQELVCIIDTLDTAVLVYRSTRVATAIRGRYWRWVKKALERRERHDYGR